MQCFRRNNGDGGEVGEKDNGADRDNERGWV